MAKMSPKDLSPAYVTLCAVFGSILLGLSISIRLAISLAVDGGLPCSTSFCALLDSSPFSRPAGVPLPWLGALYYGGLLAVALIWVLHKKIVAYRTALVLSAAGSLASIFLIGYGYVKFGGFCPWCSASAVSSLIALAALTSIDTSRSLSLNNSSLAKCLSLSLLLAMASLYFIDSSQRVVKLDMARLMAHDESDLIPSGRTFGVKATKGTTSGTIVAFVDFGCGSCQQTLAKIKSMGLGPNTCLRFTKPLTDYGSQAASLYLDANDNEERLFVLNAILADDSRTNATLDRTRRTIGVGDGPSANAKKSLTVDGVLAIELGIKGVPVLVSVTKSSRFVMSSRDLDSFGQLKK